VYVNTALHDDGMPPSFRRTGRVVMSTHSTPPDAIPETLPCRTGGTDGSPNGAEVERTRFREILERMPDHVVLFDRDERVLYVNPALAMDLGIPAETLVGRAPAELGFATPEFEPFRREYHRVLETGEPIAGERTAVTPAGRRVYSYTMTPLSGPGGDVASVMLTSRDVTPLVEAQTALAESEAKYRNLVELAPDAILIHQDGSIVFANQTAAAMLGVASPDDLVGRHPLEIVHPGMRERVEENIVMDLLGEGSPVTTLELLRRDGTTVAAEGRGAMIHFGGRPAVQVVFRDVTERERAGRALQESEGRLRDVLEISLDAVYRRDLGKDRYDYLSPVIKEITGYSAGEFASLGIDEVMAMIHPEDRSRVVASIEDGAAAGKGAVEYRIRHRNGSYRWASDYFVVQHDETGAPVLRGGVLRDVTEQKRAEEALRESEERLRLAKTCAGIGTWEWHLPEPGPNGPREYVRLNDPEQGEVRVDDWQGTVHPDDLERVEAERDAALARREQFDVEFRYEPEPGKTGWMRVLGGGVFDGAGRLARVLGVNMDITAQKQVAEALKESEARYRRFIDDDITGQFTSAPDGRLLDCNPAFAEIFGFASVEEARSSTTLEMYVAPGERDLLLDRLRRERRLENEQRFRHRRDGTRIHVVENLIGDFDDAGELVRIRGYIRDDTQRYQAEAALREREQTLQGIFRAAPVGIGMVSNRVITQVNDQLCRMTGYAPCDLIGQDARLLYQSDEAYERAGREKYAQIMAEGTGAVETQWRTRDGAIRDILLSSSPVDLARPREDVVFNALDITRLRESERSLERYMDELARSNEELQRFAYVASHDLQEPLRSIISFTQLLERRYRGRLDADADDYIAFIVEGGMRMQQLIEDLLQLSRVETKAKPLVPTEAGEVVNDVLRSLETPIREAGATVEVGEMPTVMADAAQLSQVFANLVSNAIKYRRPDVPTGVRITAEREEHFWRFAVADNGIGIEEEYFDRIFVIFQRLHTRDEYSGTGIGLAVVRKIVERHGGRIWVESAPGEGSTFYFTLPAA
jgi:PAS domain S-box-containing protein